MKSKLFILLALLFFGTVFSQEIVGSFPLKLKKERGVFQIVDDSKKETLLFLSDKKNVNVIRLSEKMTIMDSMTVARPDTKKYDNMIGYNGNSEAPLLFWSSSDFKDLYVQQYNVSGHKVSGTPFNLALKDEKVLQHFSGKNMFYIVTIPKKSNTLKLYVFDQAGKLQEKTVDLSTMRFYASTYQKTTLYGVLEENLLPFEQAFSLQKIMPENPTSLTESGKKRKCYFTDKSLILTFDTNKDYTQLITIDLESFSATEKFIRKSFLLPKTQFDVNSDSFLIDDVLFQFKLSDEKMFLTMKTLNDTLIKEYSTEANLNITYKNSDILQEGGDFGGERVLDRTSQFLRKVSMSNAGISCYRYNNQYLVTLGSVSSPRNNSAMYGGMFGVVGVLVAYAISNPTYESFNSYANRKVVYLSCLFDKNMNHVQGKLSALAFDTIRDFLDKEKNISSQTLFKLSSSYYLGYYNNSDKTYMIRKFTE